MSHIVGAVQTEIWIKVKGIFGSLETIIGQNDVSPYRTYQPIQGAL